MVVTTFTKKATQELSERLIQKAMTTDRGMLGFVNSGYYLQVSTIHGILDRLLKDCGSAIGLRSDFAYLSNTEAVFLSKKFYAIYWLMTVRIARWLATFR